MARKEKDWEVGPVLKQKADSQGTLLRGGTKYSSDARFPRGYTPERLHEVAEGIGSGYARGQGAHSMTFRDHPYLRRNEQSGEMEEHGRADNRPKRDLVDNMARSTVPMSDFEGKPGRRLHFWSYKGGDTELGNRDAGGTYQAEPPSHSNRHDIKVHTDAVSGMAPIHELGHHVSHMADTEHSKYSTPAERGAEEGFADRYAYEHFRDRSGKQADSMRNYPPKDWQAEGRPQEFHEAYKHVRGDIPQPTFKMGPALTPPKSIEQDSPTFNSMHLHNQLGLFSMTVDHRPKFDDSGNFNRTPESVQWRKASWQDKNNSPLT